MPLNALSNSCATPALRVPDRGLVYASDSLNLACIARLRLSNLHGAGIILLGHQSVRITEKHYAPWVRSRRAQLEQDLINAWSHDPLVLLRRGAHQKDTERGGPITRSSSIRKTGARGGSRTHMRKNPRRILSPQRLPFRHPGIAGSG